MTGPLRAVVIAGVLLAGAAPFAVAKFMRTWEPVPMDRLLANVGALVKQRPTDARAIYTLGRLHSLAFAGRAREGSVDVVLRDWQTNKALDVPGFPPFATVRVARPEGASAPAAVLVTHLRESVRAYARAVALEPTGALYLLGHAWMLEQGAPFAGAVGPLPDPARATADAWRARALVQYRRAYAIAMPKELAATSRNLNEGDNMIGVEAGRGILRLVAKDPRAAAEVALITGQIRSVEEKPGFITPIILSLQPHASLADLLDSGRSVRFDLAATGQPARWPWLRPHAGILVWDPHGAGRITSGASMFGSRTWQMFWRSGYEAMAALDDNRDGWLAGRELRGIAVWFDRNGNGRSDRGEVIPVAALGVQSLAVSPEGEADGVPAHATGVRFRSGTSAPTWDWEPTSLP